MNCKTWKPQIRELWKKVGKLCGWKHRRTPRMALFFEGERAAKAAPSFLRKAIVGQTVTIPLRDAEWGEGDGQRGEELERGEGKEEGEEGGPGPP